jgi:cysteinyl-tRNA synthetase
MSLKNDTRHHPVGKYPTGIMINNSLTNSCDELLTVEKNHVKFYICGPTVYNSAHLGHARAYLTFDIIRGILEDFFSLDVTYVMNITDIDDKIILRGRQAHLIEKWLEEHSTPNNAVVEDLTAAVNGAMAKLQKKIDELAIEVAKEHQTKEETIRWKQDMAMKTLYEKQLMTEQAIINDLTTSSSDNVALDQLFQKHKTLKDNLGIWLDNKYGKGKFDNDIFQKFARHYEGEFMKDMQDLGVRPPTVLTRISEYVPEVISYVERIISNGFAYVGDDHSVYFDTEAFKTAGHCYRKLVPAKEGSDDSKLLAEGEGTLVSDGPSVKKCDNDFVLWKNSKPGEPVWKSPWGEGRPGWHIECSAMGSAVFDDNMDIHGGGVDLKFPHHDNELAQGEAHYGCHQMVNNFLHAGHLHIEGLKMSKSLKNFKTIGEGLKTYSANQIRILFLLNAWDKPMNFSDEQLEESGAKEKQFHEFFQNLKMVLRDQRALPNKKWVRNKDETEERKDKNGETKVNASTSKKSVGSTTEYGLWCSLVACRTAVDQYLRDNFDTNSSICALSDLIKTTNNYLGSNKLKEQGYLLLDIGKYVAKVLAAFGVIKRDFNSWLIDESSQSLMVQLHVNKKNNEDGAENREAIVTPVVKIVSNMRDQIRKLAGSGAGKKELFELCDLVREQLAHEGIRLEDRPGQSTGWKFEDKELLRATIEAEKKEKQEKLAAKKKKANAPPAPQSLICDPKLMYKPEGNCGKGSDGKDLYSQWNEDGIPTHLLDGTEVSKKKQKKLVKAQASQQKKYSKQQQNK